MAYFIDLFSPETYEAFRGCARDISGFRLRQKAIAERIHAGDFFVCYMTRLSRWFGLLEVIEGPYIDSKPIFIPENDPFVVRFRVRPLILLDPEKSIPIHNNEIWKGLSFTRDLEPGSLVWTGKVRTSLVHLDDNDAQFLANKMREQVEDGKTYPLDEADVRKIATHTVNRTDKVIAVSVPDDLAITEEAEALPAAETRESIQVQALVARIGMSMGLSIWVPRADKAAVLKELNLDSPQILDRLPLNYDDTTAALHGKVTAHHRFLLSQHLGTIAHLEQTVTAFEKQIEAVVAPFNTAVACLVTIPGISVTAAHVIIAEIGVDMSRFATAAHLRSWAGLCPQLNESAGKVMSRRLRHGAPWLKTVLVQCAWAATRNKNNYLHAQFVRLRARRGHTKGHYRGRRFDPDHGLLSAAGSGGVSRSRVTLLRPHG
jgi:hypothetical protein